MKSHRLIYSDGVYSMTIPQFKSGSIRESLTTTVLWFAMRAVCCTTLLAGYVAVWLLAGCSQPMAISEHNEAKSADSRSLGELMDVLRTAERIPNSSRWFEIIALPNDIYALWEPGHFEKVNSFLIVGESKDVLYDTGMGIASIGEAVAELRAILNRTDIPLMVINSHNHLDHNAGNSDFDEAWIIEHEWAIRKLTEGVSGGFSEYWAGLVPYEGVVVPDDFDPATFSVKPFPREGIRFLREGDVVDLGNRQFRVIHTKAHSPDGLSLYDEQNKLFFGGDTFMGDMFLIRDLALLEQDLARVAALEIDWHYVSHGAQLMQTMREGWRLSVVRRMIAGEREEGVLAFAGNEFPLYSLDGVQVAIATDFLTY